MKIIRTSIGIFLCLQLGTTEAKVYTWTDENGQVHYGSQPPVKAETRQVEIKKHTPDQQSVNRLNQIKTKTGTTSSSASKKENTNSGKNFQSLSEDEKDRERCERYKERYERYKREGVIGYNVLTGEKKPMTGQGKRDAIENARENMEMFCK